MNIFAIVLLMYLLLNSMIIRRHYAVLDIMYEVGADRLGWAFPKFLPFLVLLFSAVFIFGFKKARYSDKEELREKIYEAAGDDSIY